MANTSYIVHDRENAAERRIRLIDNGDGTYSHDTGSGSASGSALASYETNDIEDGATYLYLGQSTSSAAWCVKRVNQDGTGIRYATVTNNGAVTTYSDAWTNRATLTYGRFDEAF